MIQNLLGWILLIISFFLAIMVRGYLGIFGIMEKHPFRETPFLDILVVGGFTIFFAFVIAQLIGIIKYKISGKDKTHGSAEFSGKKDLKNAKLFNQTGAPLGRDYNKIIRHQGHVLTCAPTGSGKGIGAVIPTLLEYQGSIVCLDIKGENYAVTANRRRKLGHKVILIDPFNVTGKDTTKSSVNWFDHLDPENPDLVSDSAALAAQLMPSEKSDHWEESARDLVRGIICYLATMEDSSIADVRKVLTMSQKDHLEFLELMANSNLAFDLPRRSANAYLGKPDKERASVLSTAVRQTSILDDPRIVQTLEQSTFDLSDLKKEKVTVYLVMPPDKIKTYSRFIRVLLGLLIRAVTATSTQPKEKIIFLIDEFIQLGTMDAISDGIGLVRGYGASFWLFVQDLSQLKELYKDNWQTFIANSAFQVFGTTDYDTAKYISDGLGKKTIQTVSTSTGGDGSESYSSMGRELLTPDEIMAMDRTKVIIQIAGSLRPILATRLNYLTDPEYRGMYEDNPYHV